MSKSMSRDDFIWEYTDEPHATRRRLILAKYPQIKKLFGHDWRISIQFIVTVLAQTIIAYMVRDSSWPMLILLTWSVSGTFNQTLSVGMHELSHNLAFGAHRPWANRLLGFWANLPMGLPAFISFKRYHRDHHKYLGVDHWDPDLPTRIEAKLCSSSWLGKLVFVFMLPYLYAFRPIFTMPKDISRLEILNGLIQFTFNAALIYFGSWKSYFYLVMGTFLGMGLHPLSGHFIAEHYVFVPGHETFSYYGPCNLFMFNVGYHNEHHDFPNIPCYRLPEVRKIASEFYDTLPCHQSWLKVLYDFIMCPNMGPYSRVVRDYTTTSEHALLNRLSNVEKSTDKSI